MSKSSRLIVTTGDPGGVGVEVAFGALLDLASSGKLPSTRTLVVCGAIDDFEEEWIRRLQKMIPVQRASSWEEGLRDLNAAEDTAVVVLNLKSPAPSWVLSAAQMIQDRKADALCTGPLSKGHVRDCGYTVVGHTGLLKNWGAPEILQGYVGREFHLVLATDHLPLSEVSKSLDEKRLSLAIQNASELLFLTATENKGRARPALAVLGLNPHAGEGGMLGKEEVDWIELALQKARSRFPAIDILGPLPSDTAFVAENRATIDAFVALYHDQGLIPFKTLHGFSSGAQVSLGLSFPRTSVDHGTAKTLFRRGVADCGSMRDAIHWARIFALVYREEKWPWHKPLSP